MQTAWSEQAGGWIQFCMKWLRTLKSFQIFKSEIKNQNIKRLMSYSRPIQWYHSHADPFWSHGTSLKTNVFLYYAHIRANAFLLTCSAYDKLVRVCKSLDVNIEHRLKNVRLS
jgi:hypothetical protein